MNTILTTVKKRKTEYILSATTASGKRKTQRVKLAPPIEAMHKELAIRLSIYMGWGHCLIGGETKEGFAYIPTSAASPVMTIERAAQIVREASSDEADPIRFAAAVKEIMLIGTTK